MMKAQKHTAAAVDWHTEEQLVPYDRALKVMEDKVNSMHKQGGNDYVWLLEHPPLYTAGTSADPKDLLGSALPVYPSGRGGQYTYHGPGQRVAYVMMNLQLRTPDLKEYVRCLEEWVIVALKSLGVKGERRAGRIGIWVDHPAGEAKIAAVGVRVRKWITCHGVSINVNPDLRHYDGIVPCGISRYGVTSLADMGIGVTMQDLDRALYRSWTPVFG